MLGEDVTPGSSNCGESLDPSAGSVRLDRNVPLNFWFGPKKIRTVKFLMEVENLTIDPFGTDLPQTPNLTRLKANLDGVYRPSEPLSPIAPVLSVTNSQIRYIEPLAKLAGLRRVISGGDGGSAGVLGFPVFGGVVSCRQSVCFEFRQGFALPLARWRD